jgi:nucleoside phosphorylase
MPISNDDPSYYADSSEPPAWSYREQPDFSILFSRPHGQMVHAPKDNVFDQTSLQEAAKAQFSAEVEIYTQSSVPDRPITKGPVDLHLIFEYALFAFAGPAALRAFVKYAMNKIIEWRKSPGASNLTVKIRGKSVSITCRADLEEVMKLASQLASLTNLAVEQPPSSSNDQTDSEKVQAVLRTEFGRSWLENAVLGKEKRSSTAVFVDGNSLQGWAREELGSELHGGDLRRLIAPHVHEPFQINYYVEIINSKGETAAKKLMEDGLRLRIVDRRGPWPGHHTEDYIRDDALDIQPVVNHLVLVCGRVHPYLIGMLEIAKRQGCETTVLSFLASKKIWGVADHLINIRTAWNDMHKNALNTPQNGPEKVNLSDRPRVVILPIRPDEEAAILSRITLIEEPITGKHGLYKIGRIQRRVGTLSVAVKRIIEQGNLSAQTFARNAIEDLDPDWIMLVGIGGGIPAYEYTLGDVIVATRVHDFSVGAYKEKGNSRVEVTNRGGPMSRKTQDLIDQLPHMHRMQRAWNSGRSIKAKRPEVDLSDNRFYGTEKWKDDTKSSLEFHFNKERRQKPLFWPVPIAGDGFLIKDTCVINEWLQHARDLAACDMELEGVYDAARQLNKEYPIICVRGISDIVGYDREPGWTKYACESAGAFGVWLLKHMPEVYFGR